MDLVSLEQALSKVDGSLMNLWADLSQIRKDVAIAVSAQKAGGDTTGVLTTPCSRPTPATRSRRSRSSALSTDFAWTDEMENSLKAAILKFGGNVFTVTPSDAQHEMKAELKVEVDLKPVQNRIRALRCEAQNTLALLGKEALKKAQEEEALKKAGEDEALKKAQEDEVLKKAQEEEALKKAQE